MRKVLFFGFVFVFACFEGFAQKVDVSAILDKTWALIGEEEIPSDFVEQDEYFVSPDYIYVQKYGGSKVINVSIWGIDLKTEKEMDDVGVEILRWIRKKDFLLRGEEEGVYTFGRDFIYYYGLIEFRYGQYEDRGDYYCAAHIYWRSYFGF